ncbi:hypothetical protein WJM97_06420 [Okeanomitos corallinicola TIOX110]|uniref:Uncharacterized protein n=1 Tax=Okeanomitos corallinicola TIOX110 TaxID=3133117 RepID=A0ABZ2UV98_9CYAN
MPIYNILTSPSTHLLAREGGWGVRLGRFSMLEKCDRTSSYLHQTAIAIHPT